MRTRQYIVQAITVALLLLWIPVSIDKLINFQQFRYGILQQPLSYTIAWVVIYTLPVLEISIVILLVIQNLRDSAKRRNVGIWRFHLTNPFLLSSLLMAAFTGYVGLALLGAWGKVPCACGSVISGMSWMQHFWFNTLFLTISITGVILHKKSRSCHPEYNEGSQDITASLEKTNIKPCGLQRE
ncbi:MauE/DoxX family redox-associated membrane protein [Sphingobacterium alkalisoli]|uniref:MauE/DoxX family redox-associated membrane protein n=1 Tax=Sphingobacterium alkalisoli TaxID=1874115 RepID=UPI00166B5B7D|nr:MauE/DoxX family redox-associated membrane protein [Sphingobacterium alkalisoli]